MLEKALNQGEVEIQEKDPSHVAAGLKAYTSPISSELCSLTDDFRALNNPNVSDEAKTNAGEKLAAVDEGAGGEKDPSHVVAGLRA